MRRIVLLVATIAVLTGSAAQIVRAQEHEDPQLKRQPTPAAVVKEHLDALNHCDVNRLMAQYPDSVHLFLPGGSAPNVVIGRTAVRALFEGFCKPHAQGGLKGIKFTSQVVQQVGDTINVQWVANAPFLAEPYYGADAYVTKHGLMYAQVTTFGAPPLKFKP
jgi:hypothetical protein